MMYYCFYTRDFNQQTGNRTKSQKLWLARFACTQSHRMYKTPNGGIG